MHDEVVASFVSGFSIEVMPRTAAKIPSFRDILPADTRVYVANIEGTPFADMLETTRRIAREGFRVVPHITARSIRNEAELNGMAESYRIDAGATEALVLAGGMAEPHGDYNCAMQLLESGVFERNGFERIIVAGHPEGNKDIDADGGHSVVDKALLDKQAFAEQTGIKMELATQFAFDAGTVIEWTRRIAGMGIWLPINVGVAGPAKLQTLLKYALACGVGPSIRVIQRRARDVTKLFAPFAPDEVVGDLAEFKHNNPDTHIAGLHVFPLGGITASASWAGERVAQPTKGG